MRRTLPLLLLAAGCAAAPRQPPPLPAPPGAPEVRTVRARVSPIVDGMDNDAAWQHAPETEVPLEGPGGPKSCRVKAVVHRGTLFLLVGWEDGNEGRGPYEPEGPLGDALTVSLPMGDAEAGALDTWVWGAARLDRAGHARDCSAGVAAPFREDAGDSVLAGHPTGSAGDVLARGRWHEGRWTVELARALTTGHEDDRDLGGDIHEAPLSLSILDDSRNAESSASPLLRLVLPPGENP